MNVEAHGSQKWHMSLDEYDDVVALQFEQDAHLDKALAILWHELADMPHAALPYDTIAIPRQALPYFHGLDYKLLVYKRAGDISPESLARIRMQE